MAQHLRRFAEKNKNQTKTKKRKQQQNKNHSPSESFIDLFRCSTSAENPAEQNTTSVIQVCFREMSKTPGNVKTEILSWQNMFEIAKTFALYDCMSWL